MASEKVHLWFMLCTFANGTNDVQLADGLFPDEKPSG